jgi:hypothetical protein
MYVLGHDDIAEEFEPIFVPGGFKGVFEDGGGARGGQVWIATVTNEGDEVKVARLLPAFEARGHWKSR